MAQGSLDGSLRSALHLCAPRLGPVVSGRNGEPQWPSPLEPTLLKRSSSCCSRSTSGESGGSSPCLAQRRAGGRSNGSARSTRSGDARIPSALAPVLVLLSAALLHVRAAVLALLSLRDLLVARRAVDRARARVDLRRRRRALANVTTDPGEQKAPPWRTRRASVPPAHVSVGRSPIAPLRSPANGESLRLEAHRRTRELSKFPSHHARRTGTRSNQSP